MTDQRPLVTTERTYRVVYIDGTQTLHGHFALAQKAFNDRQTAEHFDRFVAGGWIPLGWRTPTKPPSERVEASNG